MNTELAEVQPMEIATVQPAVTPMQMIQMALSSGASADMIAKFMDLNERHEKNEAIRAYNIAFNAFKSEAVSIVRGTKVTDGPLKGKKYADKHAIVSAVTAALSRQGLSASWRITKDERDWIEVTCTLRHVAGHSESVSMGGPPDTGPGRNTIQARSSTNSYLEKITLKAICGLAESGDDDDGRGGGKGMSGEAKADWLAAIEECSAEDAWHTLWKKIADACTKAGDVATYEELKSAMAAKFKAFKKPKKEEI